MIMTIAIMFCVAYFLSLFMYLLAGREGAAADRRIVWITPVVYTEGEPALQHGSPYILI